MSKKIVWCCDGCCRKADTDSESDLPEGWAEVCIRVEGFRNIVIAADRSRARSFELCGPCQLSLDANIWPDEWADPPKAPAPTTPAQSQ